MQLMTLKRYRFPILTVGCKYLFSNIFTMGEGEYLQWGYWDTVIIVATSLRAGYEVGSYFICYLEKRTDGNEFLWVISVGITSTQSVRTNAFNRGKHPFITELSLMAFSILNRVLFMFKISKLLHFDNSEKILKLVVIFISLLLLILPPLEGGSRLQNSRESWERVFERKRGKVWKVNRLFAQKLAHSWFRRFSGRGKGKEATGAMWERDCRSSPLTRSFSDVSLVVEEEDSCRK